MNINELIFYLPALSVLIFELSKVLKFQFTFYFYLEDDHKWGHNNALFLIFSYIKWEQTDFFNTFRDKIKTIILKIN